MRLRSLTTLNLGPHYFDGKIRHRGSEVLLDGVLPAFDSGQQNFQSFLNFPVVTIPIVDKNGLSRALRRQQI